MEATSTRKIRTQKCQIETQFCKRREEGRTLCLVLIAQRACLEELGGNKVMLLLDRLQRVTKTRVAMGRP